jgi:putative transposase
MHRSNPWASDWLKRYDKEGIRGLKDRTKIGRSPELSEETSFIIKKELCNSKQGWTTKQVEELIIKKSGIKYHYTHIYRILRKWGFKQKVPRKVHVNTASLEKKKIDNFKKRSPKYLWISINRATEQQSNRATEQQSNRATEQQSNRATARNRLCRSITGRIILLL